MISMPSARTAEVRPTVATLEVFVTQGENLRHWESLWFSPDANLL